MPQCAASRDGRIVTTRARSRPRNSRWPAAPGRWELPSVGKRLRRLLLRWQAPQPCLAHRELDLTRPSPRRLDGVRQKPAKAPPKPRQSPARDGGPCLAFGVGVTAGRSPCGGPVARKKRGRLAPLGGEVRARLIHSSPVRLYGAAFGGTRFIQPTGRRMERSQFPRTFGAPPSSMAIRFQPCQGQARTERHGRSRADRHTVLAPLVTIRT